MTMNNDAFEIACTKAVARLLFGHRKPKPGIALTGGGQLGRESRAMLAEQARASDTGVLHLEYGVGEDGRHMLTGMIVFMPRGNICHIQTQCRLFLSRGGSRGVVLPQPGAPGHFRLAPGEILHIAGKPDDDITDGTARADAWLARRLALGRDAVDDGRYQVWSQAA